MNRSFRGEACEVIIDAGADGQSPAADLDHFDLTGRCERVERRDSKAAIVFCWPVKPQCGAGAGSMPEPSA
jgi:hypothetical protein